MKQEFYIGRTACAFLLVLLLMPVGHATMIIMEHFLSTSALHYSAFAMGFVGMAIVIAGIFVRNDTKATIAGLSGGLLFWTGWVEFLFSYYAWRYGVHYDLVGSGVVQTTTEYLNGVGVSHETLINGRALESYDPAEFKAMRGSRPEYLILPATFGIWVMMMMLYIFCTRTGCRFFGWVQRTLHLQSQIQFKPMTHLPAMTTFLELNMMMWTSYLLLMFCYDPAFLGAGSWVTFAVGPGCLAGSVFMLMRELKIKPWGPNIRMAIATVIVFWTFVEILGRNGIIKEIWIDPMHHIAEMALMLAALLIAPALLMVKGRKKQRV